MAKFNLKIIDMGLSISVGTLDYFAEDLEDAEWFLEEIAQVNEVLAEQGFPQHKEPEKLPPMHDRSKLHGFSYSYLHHLRRIYARTIDNPNWIPTPTPKDERAADDDVVDEQMYMFDSHLLCHSDCAGFYLPIEFEEVIFDTGDGDRIPGGMLGSSYGLMKELIFIAPKLGIQLDNGHLSDAEAIRIGIAIQEEEEDESQTGLWIEKIVWLSLFEAARLSIQYKTAICFG
jgi:hypothetical protein